VNVKKYPRTLLVATRNPHKLEELRNKLGETSIRVVGLDDVSGVPADVEETGDTFAANAALKAVTYGRAAGVPTLADDSGLEVDALDGAPGVYSARFAGPDATAEDNNALLLKKLDAVGEQDRTARFRCALALYLPGGAQAAMLAHEAAEASGFQVHAPDAIAGEDLSAVAANNTLNTQISDFVIVTDGAAEGTVLREASGTDGFGYDPLFHSRDLGCSFAEAGELKHRVSHRARALRKLLSLLGVDESR
jgi:XTP/dITP diphosphohydrolase